MSTLTAEDRLWTRKRGDDWRFSFTTTDDVSDWAATLVQIRTGPAQDDTLIATSTTAEDVTANITVTVDYSAGELAWHVDDAVTDDITAGLYWTEVQVTVDGDVTTVLTHSLRVTDQVAVTP